jgi:hypothetical protein
MIITLVLKILAKLPLVVKIRNIPKATVMITMLVPLTLVIQKIHMDVNILQLYVTIMMHVLRIAVKLIVDVLTPTLIVMTTTNVPMIPVTKMMDVVM